MSEEKRWYVRYGKPPMRCISYSISGRFYWSRDLPKPEFRAEIPEKFWDRSLSEVAAFFDLGIKPKVKVEG